MARTAVGSALGLKNILVATDYSPVSGRAFDFAAALASLCDAKVYALHAGELANYAVPPQVWKQAEEAARTAAVELGKFLGQSLPGVKSEVLEGQGPVWRAVNAAVAEKQIDLVVLGTRGRTGLSKLVLGSVAEEILRRAPCSVLCVGPRAKCWDEVPLQRGEILYATDFSPEAYRAAPRAFAWASEFSARLTLLHVLEDGAKLNFARPQEPADAAKRLLERLLPEGAGIGFSYQLQVERGAGPEKILDTAESLRAALIVLGTREMEGFPGAATHLPASTLNKVICQAPCAVLSAR